MATPHDVVPASESLSVPSLPLDDEPRADSLFQEINARRARVENSELLQHLRGL